LQASIKIKAIKEERKSGVRIIADLMVVVPYSVKPAS
jgi:hypothetical protein